MHRWGASVFIILMFFHMARVFLFGAYKYPRELNWIVGVFLLAWACSRASPATCCRGTRPRTGRRSSGSTSTAPAPFVGPFLAQFLQGGANRRRHAPRFYSLHMLLIPGAIFALIGLHLYLVVRLGVTSPPWSKEAAGADREPVAAGTARAGLVAPAPRGGSE